ncbi:hypothetical protein A2U01_0062739, partial [Trifolium medium]|nr:hypothetical protein [Trifolium medium]
MLPYARASHGDVVDCAPQILEIAAVPIRQFWHPLWLKLTSCA